MKLILLAATALIAVPAFAQDTTAGTPAAQTTPPTTADPAQTTPADPATTSPDQSAMPADQGATPPAGDSSMTTQGSAQGTMQPPMTTGAGNPVGGYQPTQPALRGTATPGGPVVFQAAPSPSQAYPAPAPKTSYPICKKGQYDG